VQAYDDPRLRGALEQLRLLVRRVHRAREASPRTEGGRALALRLAAASPLRGSGVHLEPCPRPRRERESRVRGVLPGLPDRGLTECWCEKVTTARLSSIRSTTSSPARRASSRPRKRRLQVSGAAFASTGRSSAPPSSRLSPTSTRGTSPRTWRRERSSVT